MEIKTVKINELKPHPKNPRVHPDSAIDKLVRSIKEFGWTNPILVSADGYILAGHARLKAAEKAGIQEVPVVYLPLEGAKAEAYLIADNRLQDETDWDLTKLKDLLQELDTGDFDIEITGFDEDELNKLLRQMEEEEKKKEKREKPKRVIEQDFRLEPEILEELKQKRVFFTFSGGRDSSTAAYLMIPILKEHGIEFEMCFVDTGVEIPSTQEYVVRFAEHFGAKLTIVRGGPDFFEYYEPKKRWPSAIYRDCIGAIINDPVNKYMFSQLEKEEKLIIIRGGRADQTTSLSKGEKIYSLQSGKREIRLFNPLFDLSEEAFEKYKQALEEEFGLWEGYQKGFVRTACWCCPFQTKQQYDTIKKELPFLWEILKRKAEEWEFIGDTPLEKYLAKYG